MLKKLATPFVKFWGWLKETAWIQPLLIVGVVFAIIFSISPIVQAINDAGNASDQAMDFLNQYKYSLEGVYGDEDTSDAGNLIENIQNASDAATEEERNQIVDKLPGERFFLIFAENDCAACETVANGLKVLRDSWDSSTSYISKTNGVADNLDLAVAVIDIKEDIDIPDGENLDPFVQFARTHGQFFENVGGEIQNTFYYENGNIDSSTLQTFTDAANGETFPTPTVLLVDFTGTKADITYGVSELMFSVPGKNGNSGDGAVSLTLMDCWNHTGEFSSDSND